MGRIKYNMIREKFGSYDKIRLLNSVTGEYVSLLPAYGSNIIELFFRAGNRPVPVIDGYKDQDELINKWSKGAKLIPFPNRIKDGRYIFRGKAYQLPINRPKENHSIHGFIYNKRFSVKAFIQKKAGASIITGYEYKGEAEGYPFPFSIEIEHTLSPGGFKVRTSARNTGKTDMPFADGWHPYFQLSEPIDNLCLTLPSSKRIVVNERMIPTDESEEKEFSKPKRIGKTKFDTGFAITSPGIARTRILSKRDGVELVFWQETGEGKYNYLQVYTPPHRKSIAIEPMTCKTNAFNNKEGLITLKPGDAFSASYGVYLGPKME